MYVIQLVLQILKHKTLIHSNELIVHCFFLTMQGSRFRGEIKKMLEVRENMQDLYETPDLKDKVARFLDTSRQVYPHFVEEIQGYAEGAQVDFITVRYITKASSS